MSYYIYRTASTVFSLGPTHTNDIWSYKCSEWRFCLQIPIYRFLSLGHLFFKRLAHFSCIDHVSFAEPVNQVQLLFSSLFSVEYRPILGICAVSSVQSEDFICAAGEHFDKIHVILDKWAFTIKKLFLIKFNANIILNQFQCTSK